MTRIAFFIIGVVALFISGCSTTRKTTTTKTQAEAQLTATKDKQTRAETAENSAILTEVKTNERQNVVVDFTKVEFYPEGSQRLPADSAATDWFNSVATASTPEDWQKAKPPNVKSITKGRAVINGEKTETRETEATAEAKTSEDTATNAYIKAKHKEATKTETEEKPKYTFWYWLRLIAIVGVSAIGIIIVIRIIRKLRRNAKY